MAGPDEPVHPGGLNLFFPKVAKAPAMPKPPKIEKEEKRKAPGHPAIRAIFNAMKGVRGMKLMKLGAEGKTTSQIARDLDVEEKPWLDPDVHPILLLRDLTRTYGTDWLSWEPETIWSELDDDEELGGELPRVNKDKVMALRVSVKTDLPWKELEIFENTALAFAGMVPRFDVMQPLEPYQAALAVDVLHRIHPEISYDDDVLGYLAAILVHDGFSWVPPEFFGDVEPMMKALRVGEETATKVRQAWESGKAGGSEDAVDSQLQTLYAIKEYLALMEKQLTLTPPLPAQDYDAEADPSMPSAPARGISAQAVGSP